MQLTNDIGNRPIKEVIEEHPKIGEILNKYEIGCLECSIGTCLIEAMIEKEINEYLDGL
jgi:hypothetical protein